MTEAKRQEISNLLTAAFETDAEAKLIEKLHTSKKIKAEHFLRDRDSGGAIGGYVAYTVVDVERGTTDGDIWGLGPMAMHPDHQGKGDGLKLLQASLKAAADAGCKAVVLLGHTGFYSKAGFRPAADFSLTFGEHEEHFMALELEKGALKHAGGKVRYCSEFYEI